MAGPAARLGDQVAHSNAMAGLLIGAALGCVLAVAVVATGGLAAVAAGALIAGGLAGGALAGEYIGAASMGPPTGAITIGSPNVFINGRPAAMTNIALAICAKEYGVPQPIAQGAATVFINGMPAARKGDKLVCSAVIIEGSGDVFFDDKTMQTLDINPEVPLWLNRTLEVVAVAAAVVGFGAAIAAVGLGAACAGLAGSLVGGWAGSKGGRALGEALGLSEAQTRGLETAGGLLGSVAGGGLATRAYQSLGENPVGVNTPASERVCTSGCPISMHTGEELLARADFTLDGPLTLVWTRFYRTAQSATDLQLGHGWLTPLDEWIELGDDGVLRYCDREGRRIGLPLPADGGVGMNTAEQLRVRRDGDVLRIEPERGPHRVFVLGRGRCPLQAWLSGDGHRIDLVRDDDGQVLALRSSWGRHVLVERAGHRIAALTPAIEVDGRWQASAAPLVRYAYDGAGDLTGALDRLGEGERYAYDGHLIATRTLATGFNFHFEWDGVGPAARCVRNRGDGGIYDYRFEWDAVDPDGQGALSRAVDSLGGVTEYVHDAGGLLRRVTSPEGVTERFAYTELGQLATVTGPLGVDASYVYDAFGQLVEALDARGQAYRLGYDGRGRLAEVANPLGDAWRWRYDDDGRLVETSDPTGATTQYRYNAQGLLAQVLNPAGRPRVLWWDERARPIAEIGYNGVRRMLKYDADDRIASVSTQERREQRYTWDAVGRLGAIRHADGGEVQLRYNARGRLTHWRDANGHLTEYRYREGLSQPSERIDALGNVMRYEYDTERRLVKLVNAKGEECRLGWDGDGRLVSQVGFDGREQRYRYDAAGRLAAKAEAAALDADGRAAWRLTRFQRDRQGLLTEKVTADGEVSRFRYDPLGRLLEAQAAGTSVGFAYDALGRTTRELQDDSALAHAYNALGQRVETQLPDGRLVAYAWNPRGQLDAVTLDGEAVSRHEWDEFAQEAGRRQGDVTSRYDYDPAGRLAGQTARVDGAEGTLLARAYRRDAAGRIQSIDDLRQGLVRYVYDPADRLLAVEGARPEQFVHDPANNLLQDGESWADGDRLAMQGDRHFRYDATGDLVEERSGKAGHRVRRFEYDAAHRLQAVHAPEGTSRYRYDALGRRIGKSTPAGETRFFWDGPFLLGERRTPTPAAKAGAATTRWYLYEPNTFRPLACVSSGGPALPTAAGLAANDPDVAAAAPSAAIYHYHLDQLGTPREMTDARGRIVWSARYRAWGALALADVQEIDNPLRFQGQYHDVETGLHYNFLRYYDPQAGRFINQDPIGLAGGENPYRYVTNPLGWVDPLGLDPTLVSQLGNDANSVGVYRFTDKNGQTYVGSTTDQDFGSRLSQHMASGKLPAENVGTVQTYNMDGSPPSDIYNTEASEIVRNGGRATDGGTTSNIRAPAGTRDLFKDSDWTASEKAQPSRFGVKPDCG